MDDAFLEQDTHLLTHIFGWNESLSHFQGSLNKTSYENWLQYVWELIAKLWRKGSLSLLKEL